MKGEWAFGGVAEGGLYLKVAMEVEVMEKFTGYRVEWKKNGQTNSVLEKGMHLVRLDA